MDTGKDQPHPNQSSPEFSSYPSWKDLLNSPAFRYRTNPETINPYSLGSRVLMTEYQNAIIQLTDPNLPPDEFKPLSEGLSETLCLQALNRFNTQFGQDTFVFTNLNEQKKFSFGAYHVTTAWALYAAAHGSGDFLPLAHNQVINNPHKSPVAMFFRPTIQSNTDEWLWLTREVDVGLIHDNLGYFLLPFNFPENIKETVTYTSKYIDHLFRLAQQSESQKPDPDDLNQSYRFLGIHPQSPWAKIIALENPLTGYFYETIFEKLSHQDELPKELIAKAIAGPDQLTQYLMEGYHQFKNKKTDGQQVQGIRLIIKAMGSRIMTSLNRRRVEIPKPLNPDDLRYYSQLINTPVILKVRPFTPTYISPGLNFNRCKNQNFIKHNLAPDQNPFLRSPGEIIVLPRLPLSEIEKIILPDIPNIRLQNSYATLHRLMKQNNENPAQLGQDPLKDIYTIHNYFERAESSGHMDLTYMIGPDLILSWLRDNIPSQAGAILRSIPTVTIHSLNELPTIPSCDLRYREAPESPPPFHLEDLVKLYHKKVIQPLLPSDEFPEAKYTL